MVLTVRNTYEKAVIRTPLGKLGEPGYEGDGLPSVAAVINGPVAMADMTGRDFNGQAGAARLVWSDDGNGAARTQTLMLRSLSGPRRRMNNELNFPPNFERLVLGCIDAAFCI